MKTYTSRVVLERDEDRWVAHVPALKDRGGATWGSTKEDALDNIRQVVQMTLKSMREHGEPIPQRTEQDMRRLGLL